MVSGLPRSGTSMLMRMLEAGGLPLLTDGARAADAANPLGFYEYERVKSLPGDHDRSWLRIARGMGIKVVSPLLRYLPATLNYRVILMQRDLAEIVASQNAMLVAAGEPADAVPELRVVALFDDEQRQVVELLDRRPCFTWMALDYGDVIKDPAREAARVVSFVGRRLDVGRMAEAVDPQLYRQRR